MLLFHPDIEKKQWQVNQLTHRTRVMLYSISEWLEKEHALHVYITSMFRTRREQEAIAAQLGNPYKPSVHEYGRGVDFRVFPQQEVNEQLLYWVNKDYTYDITRPEKKSLILHEGIGEHFHLQSLT